MTRIDHERARELMLDARMSDIALSDSRWLQNHISACEECLRFSASLDAAVGAMRAPAVMAGSSLVRKTQTRVRARALEMNTQSAAMRPVWVAVAMVCAWATLTTPLLWAAFAWLGTAFSLSKIEWSTGFIFAWLAPTLAASFLLVASGVNRAKFRTVVARSAESV